MTLVEALADNTSLSRPTIKADLVLPVPSHTLLTGFLDAIFIALLFQAGLLSFLFGLTFLVNFLS